MIVNLSGFFLLTRRKLINMLQRKLGVIMKRTVIVFSLLLIFSSVFAWDLIRQAAFPANFYTIDVIGTTIWAGGSGGAVVKSTDEGLTWSFVETPFFNATTATYRTIEDIDFVSQDQGVVVGSSGTVAITSDGGDTWVYPVTAQAVIGTTGLKSVVYHDDGQIWICGSSGMIAYSPDHGVTWSLQSAGISTILYGMSMNEAGIGFIVLNNGSPDQSKILKTIDSGATWTLENLPVTGNPTIFNVKQFGDRVVLVGDLCYLGYSNDNGATWTHHPYAAGPTIEDELHDVVMNGDIGYAIGWNNLLLKTTDGWETNQLIPNNLVQNYEGIDIQEDGSLLACGWLGSLVHSANDGVVWNEIVPSSLELFQGSVLDADTWYAVGDKGYMIKTIDGGATFSQINIPDEKNRFYSCYFKNVNEGFVSGLTTGKIYRTTDGGNSWSSVTIQGITTQPYFEFFLLNDLVGYVLGAGSKVAKTIDGGETWALVGDNIPSASPLYCNFWKNETTGFAGSSTGRLYITADAGVTWTTITVGLTTANIKDIWFKDADYGVFVNSKGQIFYTTTGGNTVDSWIAATEEALDDLNGVMCDHNGVYWAAGYSSDNNSSNIGNSWSLLKSVDNGATWTQESFPLLTFNSTRFNCITSGGGKIVAFGGNNLIVAKPEIRHVVLTAPLDNSTGLDPAEVELSWTPSPYGSVAQYYQVFASTNLETIFVDQCFETPSINFDLSAVVDIGYDTNWYWAILPVTADLETPDPNSDDFMIWRFTTMTDPTANPDGETIPGVVNNLANSYPNPFNPSTTIAFSLAKPGSTSLAIYNLKGQLVKRLVYGKLNAGNYNVVWTGKDSSNRSVASGMYLYRLESGSYRSTKKMLLMK